jgi:glyoxylase-like metal-dependent hydrolase (beta-lactamase superfamily II)
MPQVHDFGNNVFGVTGLHHIAGIGVNAGFILTSDTVIHIDSGMTITDGEYLLSKSKEKATQQENVLLILTHHHSDHIFGMRIFKEVDAEVIAHENVRKFLSHRRLFSFRTLLDSYKPFIVKMMVEKLSYTKERAERELGDVKLFPPDQTFKDDKTLQMDDQELLLLYTPGHVPSETSVYHPISKTLFAGDTIYQDMPLTTRFGGPKEWKQWIESLEKLERLDIENIVPGHGKICKKDEIRRNIEYLEDFLSR